MKGPMDARIGGVDNSIPTATPTPTKTKTKTSTPEHDHLVGDGLRIKMNVNKTSLWIEGDGCKVSLTTNSGLLRVTGDGCRVRISRNLGSIEYTGDGGRILLGPESLPNHEKVKYRGDGGTIQYGDDCKRKEATSGSSGGVNKDAEKEKKEKENEKEKEKEKEKVHRTTVKMNEGKNGTIYVTRITTTKRDEDKTSTKRIKHKASNLVNNVQVFIKNKI